MYLALIVAISAVSVLIGSMYSFDVIYRQRLAEVKSSARTYFCYKISLVCLAVVVLACVGLLLFGIYCLNFTLKIHHPTFGKHLVAAFASVLLTPMVAYLVYGVYYAMVSAFAAKFFGAVITYDFE